MTNTVSRAPSSASNNADATAAATAAATPPAARPNTAFVALLSVAVLALAGAGYAYKGSPGLPSAGPPGAATAAAPAGAAGSAEAPTDAAADQARFAAMVEELATKLKVKPDNAEGWAMLARSYARLGKPEQALPAFAKAVSLQGKDPALLTDYAELMAVQNNRTLAGEPTKLIERALKLDANHPKSLALAGSAAFDRKDFPTAVKYWEQLARVLPAGSELSAQLQGGIDEARKLGGLPAAAAAAAAPVVGAAAAPPSPAATSSSRITGTVRLAPALAALAAPDDTVFVLARPAEGARMPLAVQRYKVKDLPVQFSLDDSMAMAPQARLSLHERVVVAARISKSGQATPAAGDIGGQSQAVSNNTRDLVIELTEVVK